MGRTISRFLLSISLPGSLVSATRSIMSTVARHLERTKGSTRSKELCRCRVERIAQVSPTVKLLQLSTESPHFTFKPGQWVDFFIPNTTLVGGYSMCSAPDPHNFELAVKFSLHPPTHWIHSACKVGDRPLVRVGGDKWLDPATTSAKVVILLAGGRGVNPLLSILRAGAGTNTVFHLLYSVKTLDELVFWAEIEELRSQHRNIVAEYHMTKEFPEYLGPKLTENFREGRITPDQVNCLLLEYQKSVDIGDMRLFVCGPPKMIELFDRNVDIKCDYEKWW